ncbi:MAG: aspartyl protease family protein [Acidobacteriaceae bacterium]
MFAHVFLLLSASILGQAPRASLPAVPSRNSPTALRRPAYLSGKAGETTLPFEYFRRHIYIEIGINGEPALFMLDSGTNSNILNLRTAQRLGINPGTMEREEHVGFADGKNYVAGKQSVIAAAGGLQIADAMAVVDMRPFEQQFGHRTDGILGAPFLKHFVVKLDFERKSLSIFPARGYSYRGAGETVKLAEKNGAVVIPVTLAGSKYDEHTAEMEVDTGSNVTMSLYRHCVHRLHLEQSAVHARSSLAYAINGDFANEHGTIDSLSIGHARTYHPSVDYFEPAQEVHPKCEVAGSIGNGVLQTFQAVIFDLPQQRIIFEVKRAPLQLGEVQDGTSSR